MLSVHYWYNTQLGNSSETPWFDRTPNLLEVKDASKSVECSGRGMRTIYVAASCDGGYQSD